MVENKSLIIDFTLGNGTFFLILDKKTFVKKIKNLDKTEKLPLVFFDFFKKKKLKLDSSFVIYVNVGPGHIISIRNSIVLSKIISLVFGCKLLAFNNFDLFNVKKHKKTKALISLKNQNILLNIKNKNIIKIKKEDLVKFKNYKSNLELNIKDIKSLLLKNRFAKKIVPISF